MTAHDRSPVRIAVDPTTASVVDRFLATVVAGRGTDLGPLYAPGAEVDATVPGWRFCCRGPEAIAAEYGRWFADPGRLEEQEVLPTPTGAVVTYFLSWEEGGVPHGAHHCHVLTIDGGAIVRERSFCGGRWDAALLAEMEASGAS